MPRPRPCLTCKRLTRNRRGRCDQCQPTTVQQGYGQAHKAERARIAALVNAGLARCARCGHWIHPRSSWDLDHVDGSRNTYIGVSHAKCNRTEPHRKRRPVPTTRREVTKK